MTDRAETISKQIGVSELHMQQRDEGLLNRWYRKDETQGCSLLHLRRLCLPKGRVTVRIWLRCDAQSVLSDLNV